MRIRYLLRCFSALLKMSVTRLWAYRTDFWMSLLLSGITLSADLLGLWFVASRTSVLAGWSAQGLVFLLGTRWRCTRRWSGSSRVFTTEVPT